MMVLTFAVYPYESSTSRPKLMEKPKSRSHTKLRKTTLTLKLLKKASKTIPLLQPYKNRVKKTKF
jgi:hypothetical protein